MTLPKSLVLRSSQYWMDGGTASISGTDETEQSHVVMLVQSAFPWGNTFGIPGRLYFDDELVPLRSELESQVLAVLRAAEVRDIPPGDCGEPILLSQNALILDDDIKQVLSRGPEDNIRGLRDKIVATVESPEYLSFAAEVAGIGKQAERGAPVDLPRE